VILRLRARLALLRVWWEGVERDMNTDLNRLGAAACRAVAWCWNTIKALPGVHQVGHGIATVLGLYRLDRWLIERDRRKLRELVPLLESAGMHDTAQKILAETDKGPDA
jgi:hypothetical protein